MRYKKFIFDTECVLDLKEDKLIFPFQEAYLDYQQWVLQNPNDYNKVISKSASQSKWQGLMEEVRKVRGKQYERRLHFDDGRLFVSSEVRKLPNQDFQTHGKQTTYYKSGIKASEEEFRSGKKTGTYIQYSDEVDSYVLSKGEYKSDVRVGYWNYYHKDGSQFIKEKYEEGVLLKRTEYDTKGVLCRDFNYDSDGELHGTFKDAHNNNELRARGNMRHGQMDGIWYFYYIDGRENYKIQFKDGKIIGKFIYYGADGEVLWDRESL